MISVLEYGSILSVLPPGIMAVYAWKYVRLPLKFVCILILFTALMEGMGYLFFRNGINNLWLFHLFTWVEALLFVCYLYTLTTSRVFRNIYLFSGIAFFTVSACLLFFGEHYLSYNSTQRGIGSIWACLMCFCYFINLLREARIKDLKRFPHYWMVSGFLLYFAGMFLVNLLQNYNMTYNAIAFNIFVTHSILNILLNAVYIFVLYLGLRETAHNWVRRRPFPNGEF
jgi:hypothetical protein